MTPLLDSEPSLNTYIISGLPMRAAYSRHRAHAASRAEVLDLAFLAHAAVVVVAAHRDAARARVAVDDHLHDRRGLAELVAVRAGRGELRVREDAGRADDVRILAPGPARRCRTFP